MLCRQLWELVAAAGQVDKLVMTSGPSPYLFPPDPPALPLRTSSTQAFNATIDQGLGL